ncbi:COG4223 family protein [Szabonella alba]|uniref:Inner membrane protein n=1 Tax=Szabonella alba TaxID=2804194 RepID=A0A8K0VCU5_9RHOB|nr:hypothetical protein [Szabonella alba]MBL4916795.1 hypothetical protein [Szabonella alba]
MARYVVPEGWPLPGSSPLQAQITAQADEIAALRAELAALPPAPDLSPEIATLQEQIAGLQQASEAAANAPADLPEEAASRLTQIETGLTQLGERLTTVENRTDQPDGVAGAGEVADLEAAIAALQEGLAAQEARTAEAAEATRAEITRIQDEAEAARQASAAEAGATLEQAALAQVEAAAINGSPYGEALASLAAAGHEIAPVLTENAESGLPTLAGLTERFDEPARAAIAAELRADMGDSLTDRVGSFLRAQTGARSLSPREGTDADAVLSRAEAALRAGNVDGALTEINALSEPAKAEMDAWVLQAERYRDAGAALAALSTVVTER